MQILSDLHVTHVSYILLLYSISFLLYLFVNILLHLYAVHTWPESEANSRKDSRSVSLAAGPSRSRILKRYSDTESTVGTGINGRANGQLKMPRHRPTESQQVRDAEEFELEGLISDGEEDEDSNTPPRAKGSAVGGD